jgi:predicted RNA binding protein YcfA (HicA-like mRNA interferase family)
MRSSIGKDRLLCSTAEGSHIILRRDDPFAQLVVPDHKQLDRGTLRAIIRQADMSVQDLLELL